MLCDVKKEGEELAGVIFKVLMARIRDRQSSQEIKSLVTMAEFKPADIFSGDDLGNWALQNGFVWKEDLDYKSDKWEINSNNPIEDIQAEIDLKRRQRKETGTYSIPGSFTKLPNPPFSYELTHEERLASFDNDMTKMEEFDASVSVMMEKFSALIAQPCSRCGMRRLEVRVTTGFNTLATPDTRKIEATCLSCGAKYESTNGTTWTIKGME